MEGTPSGFVDKYREWSLSSKSSKFACCCRCIQSPTLLQLHQVASHTHSGDTPNAQERNQRAPASTTQLTAVLGGKKLSCGAPVTGNEAPPGREVGIVPHSSHPVRIQFAPSSHTRCAILTSQRSNVTYVTSFALSSHPVRTQFASSPFVRKCDFTSWRGLVPRHDPEGYNRPNHAETPNGSAIKKILHFRVVVPCLVEPNQDIIGF